MSENVSSANADVYSSADDAGDAYTFLDDYGNEITRVPANKHVNIAAYMEPGKTYAPVITTGTESSSSPDDSKNEIHGSSSGGGCDSGFSVYVLALLGMSLALRHRK